METTKYTVFISDTHFKEENDPSLNLFIEFLTLNRHQIEKLYLLGDLFNTWLGDDDDSPLAKKVGSAIADCSNSGIEVFFTHGNRDYLVGKKFAHHYNMQLLQEKTLISLYGKPTLLMHGDLLCTDDLGYQRYRKIMFSPLAKKICLLLPLSWRRNIADFLRKISQKSHKIKTERMMDVSEMSVIQTLENCHAQLLIHGHTHQPAHHKLTLAQQSGERIVLGAWSATEGNAVIASPSEAPHLITFHEAYVLGT